MVCLTIIDDAIDPNRQNAKEVKALGRAAEKIEAARDDFSAAKKLTGSKKVSKLQSGVKKYESSMEELITAGEDNILQELGSALNEGIANTLGLQFYMGDN
jgi:phospholipase/lecithinase/hemolysin